MFDFTIKNGLVVDGTRRKAYPATVYLKDGLIAAISSDTDLPSHHSVDATGMIVAPGFIDPHTHSDVAPWCAPNFESAVLQGVTTQIAGMCGSSVVPNNPETHDSLFHSRSASSYVEALTGAETAAHDITSFAAEVRLRTLPINFGMMVGHGTLRRVAMGSEDRPPTEQELDTMKQLLATALTQGAFGMSLGLTYVPGTYSKTDELIELARVVKAHDALVMVHMRSESGRIFEAVEEMLTVARATGVKLHISHLKLMYNWGKTDKLMGMLDRGRAEGLRITADQYPYLASSTGLGSLLPGFAKRGSRQEFEARFADPSTYRQIIAAVETDMQARGGPERVTVANTRGLLPEADGKNLAELAAAWQVSPAEAYCRVMRRCEGTASGIYHAMNHDDMLAIMKQMEVAVGSDGYAQDILTRPVLGRPHPRSVGTFPRFLQTVRESGLMGVEDAVYKMTGLPAKILGRPEIGTITVGSCGDITVFNYASVKDCSTFQTPSVKPEGIDHVFVAGQPVLLDGVPTGARNGRFLLR